MKAELLIKERLTQGKNSFIEQLETSYLFKSPHQLLTDFWQDVKLWRESHE